MLADRTRQRRPVAALLCVALVACASTPISTEAPGLETDGTLGIGDVFEVEVFGEESLSGKHRVSEDGTVGMPLVGRVQVAGLTATQIGERLETALLDGQILREPHVSIFVLEQISKRITVMGAVVEPGGVSIVPGMTVMQAVSMAGGLTQIAAGNSTVVTRRVDGELRRFNVPVESIIEGRASDFPLKSGDIVFVPERVF